MSNLNETSEISNEAQSTQNATNAVEMPQSYVMTYTYDANNRMMSQKKAENDIEYLTKMGYDKNGNMTSRQRSSIGRPVGDSANMEVSIGTMQSNPGGESVAETFSYNALNQMVGYQNSNGTNASYAYDATGMRTSKTVNGVEKHFYYNGMIILNEGDGAEITATNFVGLTGIEGRQNGTDATAYFMRDAHGDVIKAIGSDGIALADYEYDIWGNQTQGSANTYDNPFRYCSEYMDEESGLVYLRARYYDPISSRMLSEDPHWNTDNMIYGDNNDTANPVPNQSAIIQSSNLYVYCTNNPINMWDTNGLAAFTRFYSMDELIEDWAWHYYGITDYILFEQGSLIYTAKDENGNWFYAYTWGLSGTPHSTNILELRQYIPEDGFLVAAIHAHPNEKGFSNKDREFAEKNHLTNYVVYPSATADGVDIMESKDTRNGRVENVVKVGLAYAGLSYERKMELYTRFRSAWRGHLMSCENGCKFLKWPRG